jgi:GT2 family glycosyltransferase
VSSCAALIPTLGTRPELLERVIAAYREQGCKLYTVQGMSWGAGLNDLMHMVGECFDYLSCSCDDTVPQPGWFEAARELVDEGLTPASRYFHPDGEPLNPDADLLPHRTPMTWCRSFLLTPAIFAEVGPFIDATWYADIDYSERLTASGRPIVACDGFAFTHISDERDWRTAEVAEHELEQYELSVRRRETGAKW